MSEYFDYDADAPTRPGWYATVYCWDAQEGIFAGADFWDGKVWNSGHPVSGWSRQPFESKSEAAHYAKEHDPEGPPPTS